MRYLKISMLLTLSLLIFSTIFIACSSDEEQAVTVYSGRASSLVQPVLEQFAADTGIDIKVRYGTTPGTISLLLEEGENSPADIILLQDAGALGAASKAGLLSVLPSELLQRVDEKYRSPSGDWVGVSGRSRVFAYNTDLIDPDKDLPDSVLDFVNPEWEGRLAWAPLNGSFLSFVTALRVIEGENKAREWVEGIHANDVKVFPNNISILAAVARGEVEVGLVNHYYLHRFIQEEGEDFGARNHYVSGGAGALVNVAGVGILKLSKSKDNATALADYLLSSSAQEYFAQQTTEYPLIQGVDPVGQLPPLGSLNPPDLDLGDIDDLEGTLQLLRDVGVIS
tara:strand:+ start:1031 stop:2047 length:1017 start_codon:yes stop_codon:yes gene_type:complete